MDQDSNWELTLNSSNSSIEENYMSSDSGLSVCMPFLESSEENTYEYFYSDSYRQNIDISRVSISRGPSRCSNREKAKCECFGEKDQQTSPNNNNNNNEGKRKASKQKSFKKTSDPTRKNCEGPKVAIQFDLNKLLEEIAKSDRKTCALCGKPKKNNRDQKHKENGPSGKMVHLNTRQDGKISFFLNDKLKITIEENPSSTRNKQEEKPVYQQRPKTCPYRKEQKSSIYTATSETYPVKTKNRIPCPPSCPMVKLKELLMPEDKRIMSCRTGKSETTNTSTPNPKRKRDNSMQTLKTRENDAPRSRKKRRDMSTLNAEDVEVTHSGRERKSVTREIVKDGNNVKIIIRVKRPNDSSEEDCRTTSTTSRSQKGADENQINPQDAPNQMRSSSASRKMSARQPTSKCPVKNTWTEKPCPCKKIRRASSSLCGNLPSRANKFSTVNIIMSPRSNSKELSNDKYRTEETNDYSSSEDCWSKLEEFLDRKIKEIRLNSHSVRKINASSREQKRKRSSDRKKKTMHNKILNVPSYFSVMGCREKLSRESSSNRRYSRVCFDDEVEKICKGNCGHKKCNQKRSPERRSNSRTSLTGKPDLQLKNEFIQMKLISQTNKTSKSESSIFHKNSSVQKPEQSKSLSQVKRKACEERDENSSRINQGNVERSRKLNEISIQSELEFSKNLVVKISECQSRPEEKQ